MSNLVNKELCNQVKVRYYMWEGQVPGIRQIIWREGCRLKVLQSGMGPIWCQNQQGRVIGMASGGRVWSARRQTLKQWVYLGLGAWRREGPVRWSAQVSPGSA